LRWWRSARWLCCFTLDAVAIALLGRQAAGSRDFVEYWAAGQQLLHHRNPYDGAAMLAMEQAAGLQGSAAIVMGNAPSSLLLVMPLGLVSARVGEFVWMALLIVALTASVQMVRAMHGYPANKLHWLGYTFAPALPCLGAGQVSILVLLGLTMFLRLHRTRPVLAGAALWLCALKPQLFLPFGVLLLAWIVVGRHWKVLAGAVSALAVSTAIAFAADPRAWAQYRKMMMALRYDQLPIPCLSIMLRTHVSADAMWLQYLPAALACAWALGYFARYYREWDWLRHGSVLMLVSVLAAPYAWLIDQTVLIPALLHGAYVTRSRVAIALLALGTAVIEIAALRGFAVLFSPFYLWTTPGWLAWYLVATRLHGSQAMTAVAERAAPVASLPVG
jgi:Glycosyltransferase family 87